MKRTTKENDYIPTDYEDLYRHYILGDGAGNSLCSKLIRSFMKYSDADEQDILAQEVMLRLIEHNMLERFDPEKSNFGGVIFFVTRTVCTGHLDRKGRNPITGLSRGSIVDTEPDPENFEPGVWRLDSIFHVEPPNNEEQIDRKALLTKIFRWAQNLCEVPRHKRDASLFPLLKLMAEEQNPKECGVALGVTPSTIHNWQAVIRRKAVELTA